MSTPPNPPQYPSYGPALPVPPPKKKQNPLLVGCLGCGGLLVALVVIAGVVSAVSGGKDTNSATPPKSSPSARTAGSAKPHTTSPKPKPKPKPHTVLTESGNGIKTTRTFHVHGDWDLYYSFNCADFGSQGNFMVLNDDTGYPYVNELAAHGKDVTHQHNGDGGMALTIDSECKWRIKIVQLP